jgi:hypothetical protein
MTGNEQFIFGFYFFLGGCVAIALFLGLVHLFCFIIELFKHLLK